VERGGEKWGYPGAVKNLVEMLDLLGMATEKQRNILKQIDEWRNDHRKG